jgi:hypothetical protein
MSDEFADLIDYEVARLLDHYVPLQSRSVRCSQNDSRWLPTEAREAKRLRRRLEQRYRRTQLDVDKKAFFSTRCAARDSIMKSRGKLSEVEGDARATGRMVQQLLHSKPPVYLNDATAPTCR